MYKLKSRKFNYPDTANNNGENKIQFLTPKPRFLQLLHSPVYISHSPLKIMFEIRITSYFGVYSLLVSNSNSIQNKVTCYVKPSRET